MHLLINTFKKITSFTPKRFQEGLKRHYFRFLIAKDKFTTPEPEFSRLGEFITKGDWVIDIGANIGQYTIKMSKLVGEKGRVIAFEPVPETFSHLARNVTYCEDKNVTLINAAVSNDTSLVGMSIPYLETGLQNFYMAAVSNIPEDSDVSVLTFSIDSLTFQNPIALIKIDAEGHEPIIFKGIEKLVTRDKPVLIVETVDDNIRQLLS
ncbi:FkbM family methyltransferase, partial [Crocinitomicaceae bacterium]|nr:FkbM family methyltransferase [Crocinitomicaceae bacterium]